MKNTCFSHLADMSGISSHFCSSISKNERTDEEELLKKSDKSKKICIDLAARQFLPPVDREDIVQIALLLHRLNIELYSFYRFKFEIFPSDRIPELVGPTATLCGLIFETLENGLKTPSVPDESDSLSAVLPGEAETARKNAYNPIETCMRMKLRERAQRCLDAARETSYYLVRTSIKNS